MMQSLHGPIPREEFLEWLDSGSGVPLQISRGKNQDNFTTVISLPKTKDVSYLFCDTNYSIPGIHQNDDFSFCGLYLRQDHSLRLADHRVGCAVDGLTKIERMDSDDLRRCFCSSYNIPAQDRREFEQMFGKYTDYHAEDITRITYGRNTIYEAPPDQTEELEQDKGPTMTMGGI